MQGFCLGSWCSALRRPSEEPQRLCLRVVPEGQEANVFVFRIPIIYFWKVPSTPRLPSAGLSGSLAQALGTPVAEGYVEAVGRKPVI